jgi:putative ABC transport system permease protein
LIEPIRAQIARVAPSSAVHWTSTMDEEVALEYAPARFYSVLVAAFSTSAMLLTGAGLFALLWNAAARRTGEMGLRLALGASRRSVALLMLSAGARPLAYGGAAGLLGALWIADAVKSLLYDVPPFDPQSFAVALALLIAVALIAAFIPARRAARVDPMVALRTE